MGNIDDIERLLAELEDIPATNDNLAVIDGLEHELTARLGVLDRADPRTRELTARVIDTMSGIGARITLETATAEDFGAE